MEKEIFSHEIKPIYLNLGNKVEPIGIYGADVYIVDSNYKAIIFVGSIHTFALCALHAEAKKLHLKNLTQIDIACEVYFNIDQINTLKKEIAIINGYRSLSGMQEVFDEGFNHCLNVLSVAIDLVLKNKQDWYIFVIGD